MATVTYQRALGWSSPGDPGSDREAAWRRRNLRRVESVPVVRTLWVHRSARVIFGALVLYLQKDGNKLGETVDDWGFANRDIRGVPGAKSYHAFGLAVDLDATENPMGVRDTSFEHRDRVRRVCRLLGVRWGLDYTGRPDPMHFELPVSRVRAAYITGRLTRPTRRSRELARLTGMPVGEFIDRIR